MSATPSRRVPASLELPGVYRFTVDQYHAMLKGCVLFSGDPCELLEGVVVNQPRPLSPRAATARTCTQYTFKDVPLPGWFFHIIPAITMSDSEPEPDFAVIRGDIDTHTTRHPRGDEVGLIGEVSESSVMFDRSEKGRIYARAGIPAYWIINVVDARIEVYTDPDPAAMPPAYRTRTDYRPGQHVPVVLDGVAVASIPVADLLP